MSTMEQLTTALNARSDAQLRRKIDDTIRPAKDLLRTPGRPGEVLEVVINEMTVSAGVLLTAVADAVFDARRDEAREELARQMVADWSKGRSV